MSAKKAPFNVSLISSSKSRLAGLLPVQSMDIYDNEEDYHPQGLYSSEIFGKQGTPERMSRHSFIDMRIGILHPKVYLELTKLKGLYKGILNGSMYAIWDPKVKDLIKSDILTGQTGYKFFMDHYKQIHLQKNKSPTRDIRIDLIERYRTESIYRYLIVLPAGLREITKSSDGRDEEDDINKLYRKALRYANTISVFSGDTNSAAMDVVRWNLQRTFNDIYLYIEAIISGKKGFILGKWASRNVHGGTRNVITAMDPAPAKLGTASAVSVNDTAVGLHQYMKGSVEPTIYSLKSGELAEFFSGFPNQISVVDKKTLNSKTVSPSSFVKERWSTEEGLEGLINGFVKLDYRDSPVIIDGDYLALMYRDKQHFKILHDINELPSHLDRDNVKPITYAEMFYTAVYVQALNHHGLVTRYPITGNGSIYPSNIYLRTTMRVDQLYPLDDTWNVPADAKLAYAMPIANDSYFESMSPHGSKLRGLGADFDGDKTSLNIVHSKEANADLAAFLKSKEAFLSPDGGLNYGINNAVIDLVLHNFTT